MSATRTASNVERRFVTTPLGRIHVAMAGAGFPVLLLHQTPRSWDEYRDVLPLLGRDFRAIAMDTLGFGDSDSPAADPSIELWAQGAFALLDALEERRAARTREFRVHGAFDAGARLQDRVDVPRHRSPHVGIDICALE